MEGRNSGTIGKPVQGFSVGDMIDLLQKRGLTVASLSDLIE
jgi:hypothetical protein